MIMEHTSRRVVGALHFYDVNSGLTHLDPLTVRLSPPGLNDLDSARDTPGLVRNRSNLYVIYPPRAWVQYANAFAEQPSLPPLQSRRFLVLVSDPSGRYLSREREISLPRDPDPASSDQTDSLFQPIGVALFPGPTAVAAPGWAVLRVTVLLGASGRRIPGSLIRVLAVDDADTVLGRGLTAWQGNTLGEAMVVVPGIPVTTWGNGDGGGDQPVITNTISVIVEAFVDPGAPPPSRRLPDPDSLEKRRDTLLRTSDTIQLASGQHTSLTLSLTGKDCLLAFTTYEKE